jgi:hypothetical protein
MKMTISWYIAPCSIVTLKQTDVSERRTAAIIRPLWWRQYASLKRRSASTRIHSAISLKPVVFKSIDQCFPTRVPRNPGVPQYIVRGSSRNRGLYIEH